MNLISRRNDGNPTPAPVEPCEKSRAEGGCGNDPLKAYHKAPEKDGSLICSLCYHNSDPGSHTNIYEYIKP